MKFYPGILLIWLVLPVMALANTFDGPSSALEGNTKHHRDLHQKRVRSQVSKAEVDMLVYLENQSARFLRINKDKKYIEQWDSDVRNFLDEVAKTIQNEELKRKLLNKYKSKIESRKIALIDSLNNQESNHKKNNVIPLKAENISSRREANEKRKPGSDHGKNKLEAERRERLRRQLDMSAYYGSNQDPVKGLTNKHHVTVIADDIDPLKDVEGSKKLNDLGIPLKDIERIKKKQEREELIQVTLIWAAFVVALYILMKLKKPMTNKIKQLGSNKKRMALIYGSALWAIGVISYIYIFRPFGRMDDDDIFRALALIVAPPILVIMARKWYKAYRYDS